MKVMRGADVQNIRLFGIEHFRKGRIRHGGIRFCVFLRFFKFNIGGSDQSRRDMLLTVRTTTVEPVSPGE